MEMRVWLHRRLVGKQIKFNSMWFYETLNQNMQYRYKNENMMFQSFNMTLASTNICLILSKTFWTISDRFQQEMSV